MIFLCLLFHFPPLFIHIYTHIHIYTQTGPKLFTFDHSVGPEGSQESLFEIAGKPATRAIIQGYNGTVFCYGQVGVCVNGCVCVSFYKNIAT